MPAAGGNDMQLALHEEWLLKATLHPDPEIAAAGWKSWHANVSIEAAPQAEARLLPAVHFHLGQIAPQLELPQKLRGKARATFTQNTLRARDVLPVLARLSRQVPTVVIKGLAACVRFNAWARRPMGDVDILVPFDRLGQACGFLADDGWTPKYGMTWKSLLHRTPLRRDSWNLTKGRMDLDLHWRVLEGSAEKQLEQEMWSRKRSAQLLGESVWLPSPEMSLLGALLHGFRQGTRADALQTIVDAVDLLPICDQGQLASLVAQSGLNAELRMLRSALETAGSPSPMELDSGAGGAAHRPRPWRATAGTVFFPTIQARRASRVPRERVERSLLCHPSLYRAWEALGRLSVAERMLIRLFGPMSRTLGRPDSATTIYDLRDCESIDLIGGPGWGWPEPEHTCFWADRADVRLLVPTRSMADHVVTLSFAEHRLASPAASFDVFANGKFLSFVDLRQRPQVADYVVFVPAAVLFGCWVELSFRPRPYPTEEDASSNCSLRRSLPIRQLRIATLADQIADLTALRRIPLLHEKILKGEEPYKSRFDRIVGKVRISPHRFAGHLPGDFDPIRYVLNYADLFEAEVDPFEHFLLHGQKEGRTWR